MVILTYVTPFGLATILGDYDMKSTLFLMDITEAFNIIVHSFINEQLFSVMSMKTFSKALNIKRSIS